VTVDRRLAECKYRLQSAESNLPFYWNIAEVNKSSILINLIQV